MSMVSYAQNFEDIMLWRALKHIKHGFYIDVGAQDPLIDSVSKLFYEQGWRGVHVEPTQQYADKLRKARPDETIMQVAVSNQSGSIVLYEFADTGLSTANKDIALRHKTTGFVCTEAEVQLITLDEVFNQVVTDEVHWLKIDVEGLEKAVLASWTADDIRPWILVIESTKPNTQEESYHDWEFLVLQKGYQFAYFDGLNRFYISNEHLELVDFFKIAPNIFDGFALGGYASHPFTRHLNNQIAELNASLQQAEYTYRTQLDAMRASTSWRITRPIRLLKRFFERLNSAKVEQRVGAGIRCRLINFICYFRKLALDNRVFRYGATRILAKHPKLKNKIRNRLFVLAKRNDVALVDLDIKPQSVSQLYSVKAAKIFSDLKKAIAKRGTE